MKQVLDFSSANKADKDYVDSENELQDIQIGLKADKIYVDDENTAQDIVINGKADKTYVDSENNAQDIIISDNTANITSNSQSITNIETDVTNLTTQVNTNKTNISTNAINIASNDDDILALQDNHTASVVLQNNANFDAYGYTKKVKKADRWLEGDTPNTIVDKVGDSVRFSDGLVERLGDEEVVNGDFSNGTTGWVVNSSATGFIDTSKQTLKYLDGHGDYAEVKQINNSIIGNIYKVSFSVISKIDSSANVTIQYGRTQLYNGTISLLSIGDYEFNIISSNTDGFSISVRTGGVIEIDTVSAKQLPQVVLPDAPFSPTSTDYLMDDKVHGSVLPVALTKGDIVVSGNELVDSGTVIASGRLLSYIYVNGDSNATLEDESGSADGYLSISLAVSPNVKYSIAIKPDIDAPPSASAYSCFAQNIDNTNRQTFPRMGDTTSKTITITPNSNAINLTLYANDVTVNYSMSITAVDNIHQATEDTTAGELVTSSKFQVLTNVTRKDLVLITKTGYKTVKGLHDFAPNTSNDVIASAYGYSKLGNGLYHDEVEEVVISGLFDRLNAGAYHPFYNSFGCRANWKDSNNTYQKWYNHDVNLSVYDNLRPGVDGTDGGYYGNSGAISSGNPSGRPEEEPKFYDKAYFESDGGLIFKPTYTEQANQYDLLSGTYSDMVSGDLDMSEDVGVEAWQWSLGRNNSVSNGYDDGSSFAFYIGQGDDRKNTDFIVGNRYTFFGGVSGATATGYIDSTKLDAGGLIIRLVYSSLHKNGTLNMSGSNIQEPYLMTSTSSNSLLTQGTSLSNDIIGDPANYPQDWLNHLASGKSANINPLLVGEEGEDLIPKGSSKAYTPFKNKIINILGSTPRIFTDTNGDSWTAAVLPTNNGEVYNYRYTEDTPVSRVMIYQAESQNKPLSKSTPLPIEMVLPKTVASNSHSIYKGAMITNTVTDKVAVGNGSNGLESHTLENSEIVEFTTETEGYVNSGGYYVFQVKVGNGVYIQNNYNNKIGTAYFTDGTKVDITGIQTNSSTIDFYRSGTSYVSGKVVDRIEISSIGTTPKHSTITLDTEVSPTAKSFPTLAVDTNNEYVVQVMGEELISNAGVYDGDNGEYDNLTNGTFTDLNGNTAKSYVGFTRTGVFKND